MKECADLEIYLYRREADSYGIVLRFNPPEVKGEEEFFSFLSPSDPFHFNRAELLPAVQDPSAYGKVLSKSLFSNQEVKEYFAKIKSVTQSKEWGLRLRLFAAGELHDLLWETLQDPDDGTPLAASQRILFSRYLSSQDWRKIQSRPRGDLKALIVIANPSDIEDFQLPSLDVEKELTRIRESLKDTKIPVSELASNEQKATLDNLVSQLRQGCDILYLLCHGALVKKNETEEMLPWLYLENEAGQTALVPGQAIVDQLKLMEQSPPRLVILASCESSGLGTGFCTDNKGSFVALGPLLAEAGISAVLAMHGKISVDTVSQFIPVLFEELNTDGQIDRAVAAARNTVRQRPDWWMPVLFMRLKRGRLWYTPGFFGETPDWDKWPKLVRRLQLGSCTPILGPGMIECVLGSTSELARVWARKYGFPMAPYQAEDLAQVIPYLAISQEDGDFPLEELLIHYCHTIQQRFPGILDTDMKESDWVDIINPIINPHLIRPSAAGAMPENKLATLISKAGDQCRKQNPADPHAVLASLPLPVYLTANADDLLFDALKAVGKKPRVEICRWKDKLADKQSIFDLEKNYWPDEKNPLIFHIFGRLMDDPSSLVLSQDDYFDFLIGVAKYKNLIPEIVRSSLADNALLFLGFQMDDWKFKVLLRSIISQWGMSDRASPTHVAAQIDPDEDRIMDPQRAHRYLERYFDNTKITIYWGRAEDFALDLKKHL